MELTKREKHVVDILKNCEYLKADSIAKKLSVSEKTVRVTIAEINTRAGKPVILSLKGKGYQLSPDALAEETDISVAVGDGRQLSSLLHILFEPDVDYYELADRLFISESTLEKDIAAINVIIRKSLSGIVVRRKNNRLFLEGNEEDKRSVLFNFLMKELEECSYDFACITYVFRLCDIMSIKRTILDFIREEQLLLNDIEIMHLILYSAIMAERVKSGHSIIRFIGQEGDQGRSYRLCGRLETETGMILPESEKEFLYLLFQNKMGMPVQSQEEENLHKEFLRAALNGIYSNYNVDLQGDEMFQQNLLVHLMDLYHRAKTGQFVNNPLVGDIKNTYPLIYDISVYLAMKMQEYFDIRLQEDEIGYISLHIGATMDRKHTRRKKIVIISPNRNAVSDFIENAMRQHFNQTIEILGTYSLFAIDEIIKQMPDLIVTTTPIQARFQCPVFQCSNLITYREIDSIKQLLANQEFGALENRLELLQQFDNRLFYPLLELQSKEDIIRFLCDRLVEEGYCDEHYVNYVMERESIAATSFSNYIAIPHPVEMAAQKNGIAVATLKDDVIWGENKVRIVFLFALSSQSLNLTLFYDTIAKSIDHGSKMKNIVKYTNFNSFMEHFLV